MLSLGAGSGALTCGLSQLVDIVETIGTEADARGGGEGLTTLWRAVNPAELADIEAIGVFRNLGAAEGKYFSTTAEGAASYAKQAFYGFKDPPYALIRTEVPTRVLQQLSIQVVDRGVPAVVIPNQALPGLMPQILSYFPLPSY